MQHHIIYILVSVYFIVECSNGHVLKSQITLFTFNSNTNYVIRAYIRIYAYNNMVAYILQYIPIYHVSGLIYAYHVNDMHVSDVYTITEFNTQ
jgi:hypothetical protein